MEKTPYTNPGADKTEKELPREKAILLIKPSGLSLMIGDNTFEEVLKGLLNSTGLEIAEEKSVGLTEGQIRQIYPIIEEPSEYGDKWKHDLIEHMSSENNLAIIVRGYQVDKKLRILKDYLRNQLTDRSTERGKVVENLMHVAEADEYERTHQVLFGDNN